MKILCTKLSVFSFLAIVVVLTISEKSADSQLQPPPDPTPPPEPLPVPDPGLAPPAALVPSLSPNKIDLRLIVPGINPRPNQFDELLRVPVRQTELVRVEGCRADKKHDASSVFFVTGRGGLASNPYEPLSSSYIWEDASSPTDRNENYSVAFPSSGSLAIAPNKIIEAQNWLINEKGEVVLVAEELIALSQRGCRLY